MKKITDFIINKRNYILILFIILSIVCAILSNKVQINDDITKYLPSTSETRQGMDIMESEFSEKENSSSFNLMIKNLSPEEKSKILEEITHIQGVDSVDYDETEKYNKDNYTLYTINVNSKADSEIATNVYKEVTEKYKDYEIETDGEISNQNMVILPMWIMVVAVLGVLIILLFMCESYIEPILFLVSILIAILLNSGTNIIFKEISNITSSISAILQLALSMDYSIMLMDRFRQEKENEPDKVKAMKKSLYQALRSISGSSVTTIVGLVCLVFMSFTIGRDLGLVLAKGVLFSLLSIFCVLPGLILLFDNLITKTKKKSPNLRLNKIGSVSNKLRYVLTALFVVVFVGSYLLKGNLNILFTASENDEVSKVFGKNNQIAIIYKNEDEEKVAKHLGEIESKEKVDEVLAYGNTINEELNKDELVGKLKDLGSDVDIEDYLLKIVYYKYYNPSEDNKISFEQLINFIQNDVYSNEKTNEQISEDMKSQIDRLSNFTNQNLVNKQNSKSTIASILEMDKSQVEDILTYYNSKNNNAKITLNEFVKFMNNTVLKDSNYSKKISQQNRESLRKLSKFVNANTVNAKYESGEIASLFEMPENDLKELYTYYILSQEIDVKLSLEEFADFVTTDILTDEKYAGMFETENISNIQIIKKYSDIDFITKSMTTEELAQLFDIPEMYVQQLLMIASMNSENANEGTEKDTTKATPYELVNIILNYKDKLGNLIKEEQISRLQLLNNIMNSSLNGIEYSYDELAQFLNIEETSIKQIYSLYKAKNTKLTLTPLEFVNFVLGHQNDEMLKERINTETAKELTLLKSVIAGVANGTKYSSASLSSLLEINKSDVDLVYGLYTTKNNPNQTISLNTMVNFLVSDVMNNNEYSSSFDENTKTRLQTLQTIIQESKNGTQYTKEEMINILSKLSNDIENDKFELAYLYYGSANEYNNDWKLTIEQFVNYINNDILQESKFSNFIDEQMKKDIVDSKKTIDESKDLLVGKEYSRLVINSTLEPEAEETFEFIQKLEDALSTDVSEFYIVGDSPMAYEMSKTFGNEFNKISILTMIAIFVVVVFTFKSLIIPIGLVGIIQCAVYTIMGILSLSGGEVYFIALLIVQSILMGATIDYAILYTSYYLEKRKTMNRKEAIIEAYNSSINTILTSGAILVIVTFIVGIFAESITSKICLTLSQGTLCSIILILVFLPAILGTCDKIFIRRNKKK